MSPMPLVVAAAHGEISLARRDAAEARVAIRQRAVDVAVCVAACVVLLLTADSLFDTAFAAPWATWLCIDAIRLYRAVRAWRAAQWVIADATRSITDYESRAAAMEGAYR